MTRYPKPSKAKSSRVASLASSTGCSTATALPVRSVARSAPRRPAVRPTTMTLVEANALLAQLYFDTRYAALPVGALEILHLDR